MGFVNFRKILDDGKDDSVKPLYYTYSIRYS